MRSVGGDGRLAPIKHRKAVYNNQGYIRRHGKSKGRNPNFDYRRGHFSEFCKGNVQRKLPVGTQVSAVIYSLIETAKESRPYSFPLR